MWERCLAEERLIGQVEIGPSEAIDLDIYTILPPAQAGSKCIHQRLAIGAIIRLRSIKNLLVIGIKISKHHDG